MHQEGCLQEGRGGRGICKGLCREKRVSTTVCYCQFLDCTLPEPTSKGLSRTKPNRLSVLGGIPETFSLPTPGQWGGARKIVVWATLPRSMWPWRRVPSFKKKNVGRSSRGLLCRAVPSAALDRGVTAATRDASSGDSGENEKSRADACSWARAAVGRRWERRRGQQEEES